MSFPNRRGVLEPGNERAEPVGTGSAPDNNEPPTELAKRTTAGKYFQRTWSTARRVGTALATVAAIGSIIGGFLTYFDVYSRFTAKPARTAVAPPKLPRLLVLPLTLDAKVGASESLFADGIVRDTIAGLSRFPNLQVMGSGTATALKSLSSDYGTLREKYGVTHIASGGLHITTTEFRANIEINETETGTAIWSENFVGPITDVVNVGDEISRAVVGRIATAVRQADLKRSVQSSPETLSAYHITLKARQLWLKPRQETLPQAQKMLAEAIGIDPTYAPAHVYLAFTYLTSYNNTWSPGYEKRQALTTMLEHASKALELNPDYGAAYAAQAIAYTYLGRHIEAQHSAQHALRLNGNDADILTRVGQVLSFSGEHEKAIKVLNTATTLDPLGTAQRLNFLSRAYFFKGDNEAAILSAQLCLERSGIVPCRETLAAAYGLGGQKKEAARAWNLLAEKRKDTEPERIVARLRPAFKNQRDLDRLVSGLVAAKAAANTMHAEVK